MRSAALALLFAACASTTSHLYVDDGGRGNGGAVAATYAARHAFLFGVR